MTDAHSRIREHLSGLVDSHPLDVESALLQVKTMSPDQRPAPGPRRLGGAARMVLVIAVVIPTVFAGGYAMGRSSTIGSPQGPPPDVQLEATWGGTILWGRQDPEGEFMDLQLTSDAGQFTFPAKFTVVGGGNALSPSGPIRSALAWQEGSNMLSVVEVNGGTRPVASEAANPAWSPDGQSVAFERCPGGGQRCTLVVASLDDGTQTELVSSWGTGIAWSRDGSQIAYATPNGDLAVVTVASGESKVLFTPSSLGSLQGGSALAPEWSPNGRWIAIVVQRAADFTFTPVVVALDGTVVGTGTTSGSGGPELEWRAGADDLFYTVPVPQGCLAPCASSLWVMSGPSWTPSLVAAFPGESARGLYSSPDGRALLFQTIDEAAYAQALARGPVPIWWHVVDWNSQSMQSIKGEGLVYDWS